MTLVKCLWPKYLPLLPRFVQGYISEELHGVTTSELNFDFGKKKELLCCYIMSVTEK